jgi:UDP:flavonoid glycosyltransferase YjiC (YdhE family)
MRILFSSTSALGHIQPMLPLARSLHGRGHEIAWATAEESHFRLEREGFRTVAAGVSWRARMAAYQERYPEGRSLTGEARPDHMFPRIFGAIGTDEMFDASVTFGREWRPDLVVSEAAELTGPLVARVLGVPQATHGFGLAIPPARLQRGADAIADLWARAGQDPRPYAGCYDHAYIDPYPASMQPDDRSHIGRVHPIRPGGGPRQRSEPAPDWLRAVLGDGRPVVYATCGTLFNEPGLLRMVAATLATRPDIVAVVTLGPGAAPDALGPQPEHIHVTDYVDQDLVLPRASLVVSHAGSGTFLGALSYGVPQVCVPQGADQLRNAHAARQAGAGVAVFPDELHPASVKTAVDAALSDPDLAGNARRIAAEIAAMPSPDDVARELEGLAGR